ncbi:MULTISPECIES: hypothetical protein [Bradyrhizobium]|uniref:Uncharacterized protein n=1 Tax=Bradyrhizobium aeschynomenes TaxID=2734909 RepID=A0ABX2CP89_9BRAD|nr:MULTISPECIES: hypothetical protein [Bradyrhizobium]NPU13567.1 hypothetical protein [Bradyrhizobium aeschynomenes]NPU70007.1 hypothetical protein [Bradyrhizobium aeschynomenes]NPV25812.1 hypothetical protein [Bradyrhizobium aeschynomenes]
MMRASRLAIPTLLTALALGGAAHGAPASPFRALEGSWTGGGVINLSDGNQERLRCRAAYDVGGAGEQLRLNIRCASDSYNIDLSSDVAYRGGEISGQWSEASHNASGTIEGRAVGNRIEAQARGQTFSAGLALTTSGKRQTVSIRPAGTDIRGVDLELARR